MSAPINPVQVRLLAAYFTDARLIEIFGITVRQLHEAFEGTERPAPAPGRLPFILESLLKAAADLDRISSLICFSMGSAKNYEALVSKLAKRVDELDLSVRSANVLQNKGIEYIWQLVSMTEEEVLKAKNSGRKTLNEIKELLEEINLSLGMSPYDPNIIEARRRTGQV